MTGKGVGLVVCSVDAGAVRRVLLIERDEDLEADPDENPERAISYLRRAAEGGHVEARTMLAGQLSGCSGCSG